MAGSTHASATEPAPSAAATLGKAIASVSPWTLSRCVALPDHASPEAYQTVLQTPSATVVCTEKDAVKLFALAPALPADRRPSLWTVPLELQLDPAFLAALDHRLERLSASARLSSPHGHQTA